MGLAFWRSKKRAANAAAKPATRPSLSDDDADPAAALRARARHRLIGASALLLAVAVVVPMMLDPEPKPVPENIPIDIPSERTPFAPRLSLPPVAAADSAAPPPDQAPAAVTARTETRAEPKGDAALETKATAKPITRPEAKAEGDEPKKAVEPGPAAAKAGKFAVQAAAPANEKAALELVDRLKKAGFSSYTEKVDTKDGARYRVRVGPYATRDDAEKARARLKAQGINGNLVTP